MLILDVGSGTDRLDTARGNVCIDLCKHPENRPQNFVCVDAHNLPFKNNIFDEVYFCVVEHIKSPVGGLREICRTLKEKGVLKLGTPNIFHWRRISRQMRGLPAVLSDTGHIAYWAEAEQKNILSNAGFSSIQFEYTTLPLVSSPHKTLDEIARRILSPTLSGRNIIARCTEQEVKHMISVVISFYANPSSTHT